ncbi:MAG: hypothetical protein IPL19_10530 [Sandaracinaceae bacterium]|jgi:hypothetical protein|nr:hypothetical protein [Sandaracinaceae bacterium]MBP7685202.1 hypothetical protein [Deltaproteobacteria bacterium]MBK7153200.1 hypothetical protein [Sandaracinaceae bacterium]MBK7775129.1 hypothetical protein [Sandaracinaceae bacterium]MBK8408403.1 hypothetical protein [Sandaracinaceae bacterium]
MRAIERQWANAVLSGFLVGELPREQGAAPPLGDVDYSSGIASLIEHGNPIASAGVRVALATIVTAPLWHWGQRRTMVDMSPEERCAILAELVDHPLFAVRELAILMKIQASMALFKSPAMRAWSGYGREDNRRHLGVLRAVPGGV